MKVTRSGPVFQYRGGVVSTVLEYVNDEIVEWYFVLRGYNISKMGAIDLARLGLDSTDLDALNKRMRDYLVSTNQLKAESAAMKAEDDG